MSRKMELLMQLYQNLMQYENLAFDETLVSLHEWLALNDHLLSQLEQLKNENLETTSELSEEERQQLQALRDEISRLSQTIMEDLQSRKKETHHRAKKINRNVYANRVYLNNLRR